MQTIESPAGMAEWARETRAAGHTIAFVPTMGSLHEGHLSLMRAARHRADRLVVSIFVNPLQFDAGEDLDTYPRDPRGDAAKCEDVGVDLLFTPTTASLFPPGFQTTLLAGPLAAPLCGSTRPAFFNGIVTVVLKLFNLVRPTVAAFGRKDFQQFAVLSRMVRDLDLDVEMLGLPTIREADGLAMSSRNAYLSTSDRQEALALPRGLADVRASFEAGERSAAALGRALREGIEAQPAARVDYVEILDAEDLTEVELIRRPVVAAVAAFFGPTRLIDNVVLTP
jgi:pantoate--beta-alanine ligase